MTARLTLLLVLAAIPGRPALAQGDSARHRTTVAGQLTLTTKGISTVPSFTLGKPAGILDVSIAKRGFSFDPQFRFGLDGKPWSILLWGRYRLVDQGRLRVDVGGHPALNFRSMSVTVGGATKTMIVARRFLAAELGPSWSLSRAASVGGYYLYSYGVEPEVTKHNHFVALRANVAAPLPSRCTIRFAPQAYYLKTDALDGTYAYGSLSLSRERFPISLSTIVNRVIDTRVPGEELLWNVNLHYAFR